MIDDTIIEDHAVEVLLGTDIIIGGIDEIDFVMRRMNVTVAMDAIVLSEIEIMKLIVRIDKEIMHRHQRLSYHQ